MCAQWIKIIFSTEKYSSELYSGQLTRKLKGVHALRGDCRMWALNMFVCFEMRQASKPVTYLPHEVGNNITTSTCSNPSHKFRNSIWARLATKQLNVLCNTSLKVFVAMFFFNCKSVWPYKLGCLLYFGVGFLFNEFRNKLGCLLYFGEGVSFKGFSNKSILLVYTKTTEMYTIGTWSSDQLLHIQKCYLSPNILMTIFSRPSSSNPVVHSYKVHICLYVIIINQILC